MKKTIALSMLLLSFSSFADLIPGTLSALGGACVIETAYPATYYYSCCESFVDCPADGSGVCTVAIGGVVYQGDMTSKIIGISIKDVENTPGGECLKVEPLKGPRSL